MFEPSIPVVDAARPAIVGALPAPRLVAFVRDLTAYVARRDEAAARRALRSPFAGLPALDARALCVAAADVPSLAAALERDLLPLPHDVTLAARRFARTLRELAAAYRVQGATAGEHVATIRLTLALDERLEPPERETLARIETLAERSDARRRTGIAWDAAAFGRALEESVAAALPRDAAAHDFERRPFAAATFERERTVRLPKKHFSASSLGAYAECERRWYYRYVCAAVEDRGSSASFYGTAFHWALERFHGEFPRGDCAPQTVLERKLEGYLNTAFERYRGGFETNVEYELQRRRAQRTGRRYLAWFLERARAHPFAVIGTEATVDLELGGYKFIGYIDRLDRDDATGAVTVVDYKTGNIAQTAEEYRAKVASFIDFQLPFYYWARTAAGDRVTRLALVPLKEASRDVAPVELEVVPVAAPKSWSGATAGTIGIDELERARARMIELAAELTDGPIERFPVTDDPEACRYCAYQNACRERPLAREDRYGR